MTVKLNTFVSFVPPDFEMVAVSITATSPVGKAGLVTVPFVAITPTLLEAQVMVVPLEPVADKVRFCVTLTAESAPPKVIVRAALSNAIASVAVVVPTPVPVIVPAPVPVVVPAPVPVVVPAPVPVVVPTPVPVVIVEVIGALSMN